MSNSSSLTALVMAGGRFSVKDAKATGVSIKALADVGGQTLLSRVLSALEPIDRIWRILVVGPKEVRQQIAGSADWCDETPSLLGNVQAGVTAASLSDNDRVLLIGADLANPTSASLIDFIDRSSPDAAVTTPLITRQAYETAYLESGSTFLSLREGEFTMGSQFIAPASLLLNPPIAVAAILGHRKSQLKLALSFGPAFALGLATKSLTIPLLEKRASQILGVTSTAVPNCGPDLAFDVDNAHDLSYARKHLG